MTSIWFRRNWRSFPVSAISTCTWNGNSGKRSSLLFAECLEHCFTDQGGRFHNVNPALPENFHFGRCGIFCTPNNGSRMPHSSAGRGSLACNKSNHRFPVSVFPDPTGCDRLVIFAHLSDHPDTFCLR